MGSSGRRFLFHSGLLLALALLPLAGCSLITTQITRRAPQENAAWSGGRKFDHVLIIVLENQDYDAALADPYLNELTHHGTLFSSFNGLFHPSYGNYLAMIGGRYFDTWLDFQKDIDAPTIADLLEAKGLTWRQYAEGYPGNCFTGSGQDRYKRKHVPFLSFIPIQRDSARCANVVDATHFNPESLPNYAFYTPDMDDDGHDTDLQTASRWLKSFLDPLLANPRVMEHTLIEITFDESQHYKHNHIYTLFLGNMVRAGYVENRTLDHYNVLRTIEENFGIGTLGAEDSTSTPITGIWSR